MPLLVLRLNNQYPIIRLVRNTTDIPTPSLILAPIGKTSLFADCMIDVVVGTEIEDVCVKSAKLGFVTEASRAASELYQRTTTPLPITIVAVDATPKMKIFFLARGKPE